MLRRWRIAPQGTHPVTAPTWRHVTLYKPKGPQRKTPPKAKTPPPPPKPKKVTLPPITVDGKPDYCLDEGQYSNFWTPRDPRHVNNVFGHEKQGRFILLEAGAANRGNELARPLPGGRGSTGGSGGSVELGSPQEGPAAQQQQAPIPPNNIANFTRLGGKFVLRDQGVREDRSYYTVHMIEAEQLFSVLDAERERKTREAEAQLLGKDVDAEYPSTSTDDGAEERPVVSVATSSLPVKLKQGDFNSLSATGLTVKEHDLQQHLLQEKQKEIDAENDESTTITPLPTRPHVLAHVGYSTYSVRMGRWIFEPFDETSAAGTDCFQTFGLFSSHIMRITGGTDPPSLHKDVTAEDDEEADGAEKVTEADKSEKDKAQEKKKEEALKPTPPHASKIFGIALSDEAKAAAEAEWEAGSPPARKEEAPKEVAPEKPKKDATKKSQSSETEQRDPQPEEDPSLWLPQPVYCWLDRKTRTHSAFEVFASVTHHCEAAVAHHAMMSKQRPSGQGRGEYSDKLEEEDGFHEEQDGFQEEEEEEELDILGSRLSNRGSYQGTGRLGGTMGRGKGSDFSSGRYSSIPTLQPPSSALNSRADEDDDDEDDGLLSQHFRKKAARKKHSPGVLLSAAEKEKLRNLPPAPPPHLFTYGNLIDVKDMNFTVPSEEYHLIDEFASLYLSPCTRQGNISHSEVDRMIIQKLRPSLGYASARAMQSYLDGNRSDIHELREAKEKDQVSPLKMREHLIVLLKWVQFDGLATTGLSQVSSTLQAGHSAVFATPKEFKPIDADFYHDKTASTLLTRPGHDTSNMKVLRGAGSVGQFGMSPAHQQPLTVSWLCDLVLKLRFVRFYAYRTRDAWVKDVWTQSRNFFSEDETVWRNSKAKISPTKFNFGERQEEDQRVGRREKSLHMYVGTNNALSEIDQDVLDFAGKAGITIVSRQGHFFQGWQGEEHIQTLPVPTAKQLPVPYPTMLPAWAKGLLGVEAQFD